ncbi:MAG: SAM-dependent methyltransferase [Alphaproteobacteria bacterium]|nr:SAM-dependent methyltransferase [Alphaproteobacteria bacterium]
MSVFFSLVMLAALLLVFTNEYFQQKLGVSPMPTVPAVRAAMISLVPEDSKDCVMMELGSGWGGIVIDLARRYPSCRIVGVEGSIFPYLFSRLRLMLPGAPKNARVMHRNFFTVPLNDARVILCYLCNPLMAKLKPKFEKELPKGACVISSTFYVPDWVPEKTIRVEKMWETEIFLYRMA